MRPRLSGPQRPTAPSGSGDDAADHAMPQTLGNRTENIATARMSLLPWVNLPETAVARRERILESTSAPGGCSQMVETTPAPAPGKAPQRGAFAWVGAFTGFYPAQSAEFAHLYPVTRFLYASRSVILVIS